MTKNRDDLKAACERILANAIGKDTRMVAVALLQMLERPEQSDHPEQCPITGYPFFMVIEHPERGMVATYGGPFDSYTIPEVDEDQQLTRERYDHDAGAWVDGCEAIGLYVVKEEELRPAKIRHVGECAEDELAKDVCDDMYGEKCDDVGALCDALLAVYSLAGESAEIRKIVHDAIREHGGANSSRVEP